MEFSLREDYTGFDLEHTKTGLNLPPSLQKTQKIVFNTMIKLRASKIHSFVEINK